MVFVVITSKLWKGAEPDKNDFRDNSQNRPIILNDSGVKIDPDNPPMYIFDGKIITSEELNQLNPSTIGNFHVLKDESATRVYSRVYGEKAKNGVIVLSSKEKSESGATIQPGGLSQDHYFYREIDEKPQFPGGKTEMMRFLARNMKYPVIASEKGAEGTALVRFTVTQTGQIANVGVINDIDPSLKQEAVRSIMKMPVWDPGKKNGKAVRCCMHHTHDF